MRTSQIRRTGEPVCAPRSRTVSACMRPPVTRALDRPGKRISFLLVRPADASSSAYLANSSICSDSLRRKSSERRCRAEESFRCGPGQCAPVTASQPAPARMRVRLLRVARHLKETAGARDVALLVCGGSCASVALERGRLWFACFHHGRRVMRPTTPGQLWTRGPRMRARPR